MPQIFHHSTNFLARLSIFGAVFILLAALWVGAEINRSSWNTGQWVERQQPVQFSHKHHSGDDGIDCRYCHTSVETSSSAGMPPTKTCMNCHSQIWADSPALAPVRESFRTGTPIRWTRVHRLPGYAYFDHQIHIAKGVGCVHCHGRVDTMPLVAQEATLYMEWCLDCHRHPERAVGPREQVFNLKWEPDGDRLETGRRFAAEYQVRSRTDCVDCHR